MQQTGEAPADARRNLVYIARFAFEDGKAFRGGALVVDDAGTPREFRCTSPVRPNATQRILYGSNLDPFILLELMGRPLLQALRETADIILVNDRWLLDLREHVGTPVIFLRHQGAEVVQPASNASDQPAIIEPISESFDPVVLQNSSGHPEDLTIARPLLQECSKRLDVMEPFARIGKALERIHEEKGQDK